MNVIALLPHLVEHYDDRSKMCIDAANNIADVRFIHSFIQAISVAPLQVHYYSKALPTQHG